MGRFAGSLILLTSLAAALPTVALAEDQEARSFAQNSALADLPAKWSAQMELFDVPGGAIAIVKDGNIYIQTFGIRDPDGARPVTADTMFYIASITKTYNAMALCAMEDDGMLSLNDTVKQHLPRFELPDGHEQLEQTVTVRDLLCHRYGINSSMIVGLDAFTGDITEDRYWHWLQRGVVAGETAYTNVNFTLAGKVIERVAGMDWRDWLDQRILQPAGMSRTTGYASRLYNDADCAIPLEWTSDGFVPTEQRKTDRTMHAAGGLATSAMDGARWIMLNLDDGVIEGTRVISSDLARSMRDEHSTHDPQGTIRIEEGFGLGWHRAHYVDAPLFAHGGGYVGTFAYVGLHPEQNAGFFVLVNAGGFASGWGTAVAVDCSRALTGKQPPWEPWERFTQQVQRIKAERKTATDSDQSPESVVTAANLTRPIGLYTGAFRNQWLGTLIITRSGDELSFAFGDAPQDITPGDSPDTFTLNGMFNDGSIGAFIVDPGGEINRIRITDSEDVGEFIFER